MSLMLLLLVPGTFALLFGMLLLSAWVEDRVLSPQSLIMAAVRTRGSSPELAELLVARESERLLDEGRR